MTSSWIYKYPPPASEQPTDHTTRKPGGGSMSSFEKIQYMATAHWLLGYADSLDKERYPALIHRLQTAADLLLEVWEAALLEEEKK